MRSIVLAGCLLFSAWTGTAVADSFVTAKDGQLWLDGKPYSFAAANSYELLKQPDVTERFFRDVGSLNLNAIRFWGFSFAQPPESKSGVLAYNNAPGTWPAAIEYPEETWQQLDLVLKRAGERHVRVIIPLINYWPDIGGIGQFYEWTGENGNKKPTDLERERFYTSEKARSLYVDYVKHMLYRVNHLTGVAYKDDPTILMWEVINEARGRSDKDGKVVPAWVEWAATEVKKIDQRHLVGDGGEGFYANYQAASGEGPGFDFSQYPFQTQVNHHPSRLNPATNQWESTDTGPEGNYFPDTCRQQHIDVCSIHAWPYNWYVENKGDASYFTKLWVESHVQTLRSQGVQKPLYVGEFGLQLPRGSNENLQPRNLLFKAMFEAASREKLAGAGFWVLTLDETPPGTDPLVHSVYCNDSGRRDSTCELISNFGKTINSAF